MRYGAIILILGALLLAVLFFLPPWLERLAGISPGWSIVRPGYVSNKVRLMRDPDGKRYYYVRWARRSKQDIITLKIPAGYVPISDTEKEFPEPYMREWLFDFTIWDMAPWWDKTKGREPTKEESRALVNAYAQSILMTTERTLQEQISLLAEGRLWLIRAKYRNDLKFEEVEKEPRFGFKRLGARRPADKPIGYQFVNATEDYFYKGETPENPTEFMTCTEDAVPDDPPPDMWANALCAYIYPVPELSMTLKLRFKRRHIEDWPALRQAAIDLMTSWIIAEEKAPWRS